MNARTLRRIRRELKISQRQLAERLGVDRVTVARWEMGMHPVPGPAALAITMLARDARKGGDSDG